MTDHAGTAGRAPAPPSFLSRLGQSRNALGLAFMLPAFRNGRHGAWKEVRTERCTAFDIETRRPRPVNTDGELVTFTPAHVRVIPDAIEVFAPAA